VDSERLLPVTPSKKLLLRRMVAQGRLWMSSSSSRCIVKSGLTPDERTIFAYATAASSIVTCSYSDGLM
jgi:hypothetical protein